MATTAYQFPTPGPNNVASGDLDITDLSNKVEAALGPKNATTGKHEHALDELSDVDAAAPTAGQALVWDAVVTKWKAGTVSGGGGTAVLPGTGLTESPVGTFNVGVGSGIILTADSVATELEVVSSATAPATPATGRAVVWIDPNQAGAVGSTHTHPEDVKKAGDTMTGNLIVPATPASGWIGTGGAAGAANPLQAATVDYVEQTVTVSLTDPLAGTDIPARDGLVWMVVTP